MYYSSLVRFFKDHPRDRRAFLKAYTFELFTAPTPDYWWIGKGRSPALLDCHKRIFNMVDQGVIWISPDPGSQRATQIADALFVYMDEDYLITQANALANYFDTGAVYYMADRYNQVNARQHPAFHRWAVHFASIRGEVDIDIDT